MLTTYKCPVTGCGRDRKAGHTLCYDHTNAWVKLCDAIDRYDKRLMGDNKSYSELYTAFYKNMLTPPHLYPARCTAEEVYDWLRAND